VTGLHLDHYEPAQKASNSDRVKLRPVWSLISDALHTLPLEVERLFKGPEPVMALGTYLAGPFLMVPAVDGVDHAHGALQRTGGP